MAKINIVFDNKNYQIDESSFAAATAELKQHLSTTMSGSGATVTFGGMSYNIDSTKLSKATTEFVSHLSTIAGSGYKVKVGGIEYGVGADKLAGALGELETVFGGFNSSGDSDYNHDDPALHPTEIQEGAVYMNINSGVYSEMPDTVTVGDVYLYQDYMYAYGLNHTDGWQVAIATDDANGYWNVFAGTTFGTELKTVLQSFGVKFNLVPIDQISYGAILESINGVSVVDMRSTFQNCNALTSIIIPNSITSIGKYAFSGCTSLTSITYTGTAAQWNVITKGTKWNKNVPATYVQCTDGQVAL